MSITVQERHEIEELLVLMFNAAPGSFYLQQIVSVYEANGHNLSTLANILGSTPAYQSVHPNFQDAAAFAADLLTPLGLQNDFNATTAVMNAFNSGSTKAQITYGAYTFLNQVIANPSNYAPQYVNAANIVENKATVADYFDATKNISVFDFAQMQAVLNGVTASASTVATAEATINANYDPQTFTLTSSAPTITEGDSGLKTMTFTLTLNQVPNIGSSPVVVNFQTLATGTATAGDDFQASTGTVTFAQGQTVATVSVQVIGDAVVEGAETVNVLFSGSKLVSNVTATGTITNDDAGPVFSSGAIVTVNENLQAVTVVTATDANGDAITYSIAGGLDAAKFTINPDSGALNFAVAPNFEAPTDSNGDNLYQVTVRASDGRGNVTDQAIFVTVADVFEPPPNLNVALTTGADTGTGFVLGLGNDTFNGRTNPGGGANANSLNTTDVLNGGGAGTDLVTALLTVPGVVRPTLTNIDIVDITATDPGVVVDLLNTDADLDTVRSTQSTAAFLFDNVGTPANIELVLQGTGVTVLYRDAALAGTNNINVNLDNVTAGTVTLGLAAGSTVGVAETITVNSLIGAANTLTNVVNGTTATGNLVLNAVAGAPLTVNGSNATVVTAAGSVAGVTFSGDAATYSFAGGSGADTLNVKAGTTVTGVTGTEAINVAAGGKVTVTDGTAGTITMAGAGTVTSGSGADSITATAAGVVSINSGAGADVINRGANLTAADVVNGGADADTLRVSASVVDAQFAGVTGIETLQLDGAITATLDTNALLDAGAQALLNITNPTAAANSTVTLEEQAIALTLFINGGTGEDTVTVQDTVASAGVHGFTLNINEVDIVNHGATAGTLVVNVTGGTSGVIVNGSAAVDSVTGGSGADTLNTGANGVGVTDFFDGMGGTDTLNNAGGTTTFRNVETVNIFGTSTVTEIAGGSTVNVTVNDNGNSNVITLLGGSDTVNLGAGSDNVNLGAGANLVKVLTANLTGGAVGTRDTLTGGAGVDTLEILASGAVTDAQLVGVTLFDTLKLDGTSSATLDVNAKAAGFTNVIGASGVGAAADNAVTVVQQTTAWTLNINGGEDFADATGDNTGGADGVDDRAGTNVNADTDAVTVGAGGTATLTLNVTNVETVTATAATGSVVVNVIDSSVNIDTNAVDGDGVIVSTPRIQAVTVTGGAFADTINGGGAVNSLTGAAGNDSMTGGAGADSLIGGAGRDTMMGGDGNDHYVMTAAELQTDQDMIVDSAGFDTLHVFSGAATETLTDLMFTGTTSSGVRFTGLEEIAFQSTAATTFNATMGNFTADSGFNVVTAGPGATLNLTFASSFSNPVTVNGGAGADTVNGAALTTMLTFNDLGAGGLGDSVSSGTGADLFNLVEGANSVMAGAGADTINLGTGVDNVNGEAGADVINAGLNGAVSELTDADVVVGGADSDTLNITGDTTLTAANLVSTVEIYNLASQGVGGVGASGYQYSIVVDASNAPTSGALTVNAGSLLADVDAVTAGIQGAETLAFDASVAAYAVNVTSGGAGDFILGGTANDTITSGDGNDFVGGGAGTDLITSGNGDDTVVSGGENDTVDAGAGNDMITGGGGMDRITVGDGTDTVIFTAVSDSTGALFDTIVGFTAGTDKLQFELPGTPSPTGRFIAVSSFTDGLVSLDHGIGDGFYNTADNKVYIDADGDGQINQSVDYTVLLEAPVGVFSAADLIYT